MNWSLLPLLMDQTSRKGQWLVLVWPPKAFECHKEPVDASASPPTTPYTLRLLDSNDVWASLLSRLKSMASIYHLVHTQQGHQMEPIQPSPPPPLTHHHHTQPERPKVSRGLPFLTKPPPFLNGGAAGAAAAPGALPRGSAPGRGRTVHDWREDSSFTDSVFLFYPF